MRSAASCHAHCASLALMDAEQTLRGKRCFARVTERIVDVCHAVDRHMTVGVAVSIDMNGRVETSQLALQSRRAQDGVKKPAGARNEPRHQVDARQKVRVRDDLAVLGGNLFVIERLEMSRAVSLC